VIGNQERARSRVCSSHSARFMTRINSVFGGLLALALIGCDNNVGPVPADPVHGVLITITAPGRCLAGGCDPASSDATTLGLVRILNTGTSPAYLATCGPHPALGEQQFIDGEWKNVGPAITCTFPAVSGTLAAGDSIQLNWFFGRGRHRLVLTVAGVPTMADETLDTSASFDIP
jgi:hypothetical protein